MLTFRYGGRNGQPQTLEVSPDHLVVRTRDRSALDERRLSPSGREAISELQPIFRLPRAGVEVHQVAERHRARKNRAEICTTARAALKTEGGIEFAGRMLWDRVYPSPVLYTENLFLELAPSLSPEECRELIDSYGAVLKRPIDYLPNAYFVAGPAGCGLEVFDLAEQLLQDDRVELCHPELIKRTRHRGVFPQQWHLATTEIQGHLIEASVEIEAAWATTQGEGTVIAVIDDGFDLQHEEFASPDKIVAPRDATTKDDNPSPDRRNNHGTACAGVACAEGLRGASGVAPKATLMPIRLVSGLGSQDEADALVWAAEHGADVISCSWGPEDGDPWNPADPQHQARHPLPDSTRRALERVTDRGRDGKGCVITWAAGNGNEEVENDGYASYERVIAVAACNDQGIRSLYSDFGAPVWCSFPSNDLHGKDPRTGIEHQPRTPGIWTTDRSRKMGYNPGTLRLGDRKGNYTNDFGGTSSACPGVAGIAALMLSAAPDLTWRQIKDLLARACEPIDLASGTYDSAGHSPWYGFGRVQAALAVELATETTAVAAKAAEPLPSRRTVEISLETQAPAVRLWLDENPLELVNGTISVSLEPEVTYILSWWIEGDSGTPYSIRVHDPGGAVEGALPVERRIALQETKTAGSRKLRLR